MGDEPFDLRIILLSPVERNLDGELHMVKVSENVVVMPDLGDCNLQVGQEKIDLHWGRVLLVD